MSNVFSSKGPVTTSPKQPANSSHHRSQVLYMFAVHNQAYYLEVEHDQTRGSNCRFGQGFNR